MKQQTDPMISDAFKNWKILLPTARIKNESIYLHKHLFYPSGNTLLSLKSPAFNTIRKYSLFLTQALGLGYVEFS